MKKNVSGQKIGCQLISKTDGSDVTTGTTTVYVTLDAGTQAQGTVGSGACTHEGNGAWTYAPSQAETNGDHFLFTFVNSAACSVGVQGYTDFPQTGDAYDRIGANGASLTSVGLADGAITTAKIADGALTAAKFASGAFDAVWTVAARTLTSFGTLVADMATAVWGATTRILTAGTNIVLAKGTGVTGFNDLSAAQANAEADAAISDAGIVSTLAAIDAKTTNLPSDPADQSLIIAATNSLGSAIAALNNVSTADLAAALATYDGPTKAELDAAVATLATAANLALVKAQTDKLTFNASNQLAANVKRINDVVLTGTGVLGDEIGPA